MADLGLLDKLRAIKQRFDEVADLIIQPDIVTDQTRYAKLNKEYSDLKDFEEIKKQYENLINVIEEADQIIQDENVGHRLLCYYICCLLFGKSFYSRYTHKMAKCVGAVVVLDFNNDNCKLV